jgi:asparagine N-glycosylation enzyme membrane subunit Stt3
MKNADDAFAAIAVSLLLILTAWGNAIAMFAVSAIGLVIAFIVFKGRTFRGSLLAATVGLVTAAAVALAMFLSHGK